MSLRTRITALYAFTLLIVLLGLGAALMTAGFGMSQLAPFLVLAGAFGVALSYAIAGYLTGPLTRARGAMRQLARGDLPSTLELPDDEIGQFIQHYRTQGTRLRETLEELRDEREKSSAMLGRLADGLIVVDPDGHVALFNKAAERIFGIPAGRVAGRNVAEVLLEHDLSTMMLRALRQGVTQSGEVQLTQPADRVLEVFVTRVESERGRGYGAVMVLHDLTDIRRLENIRRDFVANVSHELRTPVASIRAMAETLLLGAKDDPEAAQQFLDTMTRETERLTALLDDLLELARIESGKRELAFVDVDLREVLDSIVEKLRPQAERKQIAITVEAGAARIHADADALQQILVNLLDNAIKYTPANGRVECRVTMDTDFATIRIIDTGVGIPREDLPRIFERFYRVDKARSRELGGTGLGLSIVKHLVDAQGGTVQVESDPGQGSAFSVLLPIRQ